MRARALSGTTGVGQSQRLCKENTQVRVSFHSSSCQVRSEERNATQREGKGREGGRLTVYYLTPEALPFPSLPFPSLCFSVCEQPCILSVNFIFDFWISN